MGVVESQLTDRECCSHKYANYIVGSLSNPPNGPQYTLSAVNSIQNRLQDVGFFLSLFGPWDGLSQIPGSGIVILQHEYDNGLYGPSCLPELVDRREEPIPSPMAAFSADGLKVYPSAASDFLNVEISSLSDAQDVEITLFDLQGAVSKSLYSGHLDKGEHLLNLPVHEMPKGNYIVRCRLGARNHSFKVLIL